MRALLPLAAVLGLLASPAAAAAPAALKSLLQTAGPRITLGDLFEGVSGAAAAVSVAPAPANGAQAVLDAALVQAAARRAGLDWANAEGRRRLIVGSAAPRTATAAAARTHAPVLAYARSLAAGEILAASDLVWSEEAVAPPDALADSELAIGKAAKRPLRQGAAAAAHDLGAPRVIRRDDAVQVAFEEGGVTLLLTGKALGEAAVGDAVSISNPASRKTIDAVASGPGRAVVGAAAEALRARAFPNLTLASAR